MIEATMNGYRYMYLHNKFLNCRGWTPQALEFGNRLQAEPLGLLQLRVSKKLALLI